MAGSPLITDRRLLVGATSWHVRESGSGEPTLLLLHGGGLDSGRITYGPCLARLSRERRVIVPDLPGFGESPYDERLSTGEAYADAVEALVRELDLHDVVLGGLSLGGGIALGLALRHPPWLRKLVLVAPYGLTRRIPTRRLALFVVRRPRLNKVLTDLTVSRPSVTRFSLRFILANKGARTPEAVAAVMAEGRRPDAGRSFRAFQASEVTPDGLRTCYLDDLAAISVPTLILSGAQDRLVPTADCRLAAARIPHARLEVFAACSHWLPRDQPERFASVIDTFLHEAQPPQPCRGPAASG